jgi:hypothetical protein
MSGRCHAQDPRSREQVIHSTEQVIHKACTPAEAFVPPVLPSQNMRQRSSQHGAQSRPAGAPADPPLSAPPRPQSAHDRRHLPALRMGHDDLMSTTTWIYPDFADAVWKFVPDALQRLKEMFGTPRFGKPRYVIRSWQRDEREIDQLRESPIQREWLLQHGLFSWEGSRELCDLPSYQNLEQVVRMNDTLDRRIYAAYGVVAEKIAVPDGTPLLQFIEKRILEPLIYDSESFEMNEALLIEEYRKVESALNRPVISIDYIVALRNVWITEDFDLNTASSLRRLTDEEINTGISFGAIEIDRRENGRATLGHHNQCAISFRREMVVDDSILEKEQFKNIIAREATAQSRRPLDLANMVVAALNLYSDTGATEIGGHWSTVTLSLTSISFRIDTDYPPAKKHNRGTTVLGAEDSADFKRLFGTIEKQSTWTRLRVALMRFSSGTCRISSEEAVLDLAIAAESLFGAQQPGEATYKISLHAAIFLANPEWSASAVRSFFTRVYAKRNAIVHGTSSTKGSGKLPATSDIHYQLEEAMRKALNRAVLELSEDSTALNWGKRLDLVLDKYFSPQEPTLSGIAET